MSKAEEIRKRLIEIAGKNGPIQTILGTVVSVDESESTCIVEDDGNCVFDVHIHTVVNDSKGFSLIPKIGSWVFIARIEDDDMWSVIKFSEIEKFSFVVGNATFEYDGNKFEVSKGSLSLKGIMERFITEVIAIYAPKNVANLTALKNEILQLLK